MAFSCNIIVTKSPEGIYKAGETVNGVLEYSIKEPTKYKDITLSLIGKGDFFVSKGNPEARQNFVGKEYYIQQTKNVLNKRPDETVTLPIGSYRFSFEFHLPHDIPSSCSGKRTHGTINGTWNIKYHIKAIFEKPSLLSIKKTCKNSLVVHGFVNPIAPEGPILAGLKKSIINIVPMLHQSGRNEEIHLRATIAKAYLAPGELIKLNYEVHNDSNVNIKKIITYLKQRTSLTSSGVTNELEKDLKDCRNESHPVANNTKTNIEVSLPTKPELYSIQHSKIIKVEFFVIITVDLPLPHINASLEIPIVIGKRQKHDASDFVELYDGSNDVNPPTYKQAMSEG